MLSNQVTIFSKIFYQTQTNSISSCEWIQGHLERRKPEPEWSVHEKMQARADILASFAYTSTMCIARNPPTLSFFADTIKFELDGRRLSFPAAAPLVRENSSRSAKIRPYKKILLPSYSL